MFRDVRRTGRDKYVVTIDAYNYVLPNTSLALHARAPVRELESNPPTSLVPKWHAAASGLSALLSAVVADWVPPL